MSEYTTTYVPVYPATTTSAPYRQPYVIGYRGATPTMPNPGEHYVTDGNGNLLRAITTKTRPIRGTDD